MIRFIITTLLWCAGAGATACAPHAFPSDTERVGSFKGLSAARVGDESLDLYLRHRTAVLIGESPGGEVRISEAAAIDPRGYFLTAAHCLEATELHLFYFDGLHAKVATPRVVAVKKDKDRDDFAIIHVEGTPRTFFAWADDQTVGATDTAAAVGGGPDETSSEGLVVSTPQCIAGRIVSVEPSDAIATRVLHDLPLRPGDSGGPLATADGKLIGVNTGVRVSWLGAAVSMAIRPDPRWVRSRIERDYRERRLREESGILRQDLYKFGEQ